MPLMRRSSSVLLTPPSLPIFVISVVLAAAALLVHYAGVSIPILSRGRLFDVLAIAYVLLVVGVIARRL
jgi:hypothetical protein